MESWVGNSICVSGTRPHPHCVRVLLRYESALIYQVDGYMHISRERKFNSARLAFPFWYSERRLDLDWVGNTKQRSQIVPPSLLVWAIDLSESRRMLDDETTDKRALLSHAPRLRTSASLVPKLVLFPDSGYQIVCTSQNVLDRLTILRAQGMSWIHSHFHVNQMNRGPAVQGGNGSG